MGLSRGQESTLEEVEELVAAANGRLEEGRELFLGGEDPTVLLLRMKERKDELTLVSETPTTNAATFLIMKIMENGYVAFTEGDEEPDGLASNISFVGISLVLTSMDEMKDLLDRFCDAWEDRIQADFGSLNVPDHRLAVDDWRGVGIDVYRTTGHRN